MSGLQVLRSGMGASIQDFGRTDFMHLGIARSGALDPISHEMANRLVGNPAEEATIELTQWGDLFEFQQDTVVAITGADLVPYLEFNQGDRAPMPQCRPVLVRSGVRLGFDGAKEGLRSYLAFAGGIAVPMVLGSRSTLHRAGLGGFHGRRLQTGDRIPLRSLGGRVGISHEVDSWASSCLSARDPHWLPKKTSCIRDCVWSTRWYVPTWEVGPSPVLLRVLLGSHFERLNRLSQTVFLEESFQVTKESDRMGVRLHGKGLDLEAEMELASHGIANGTIQLPPNGQPILILADGAPTGGYPRIGHVIGADWHRLGQLRPGDSVRFLPVTLEEAHRQRRIQRETCDALAEAIQREWKGMQPCNSE